MFNLYFWHLFVELRWLVLYLWIPKKGLLFIYVLYDISVLSMCSL